jgi:hypothetical protein
MARRCTLFGWVIRLLALVLSRVWRGIYILALGISLSLLIHLDLDGRGLGLLHRLPAGHRRDLRLLRLKPVLGKAVSLPVSVVLVGVLASFAFNNILFAFLVVPVLASLRILAGYLYAKFQRQEPFPDEPTANAHLPDPST